MYLVIVHRGQRVPTDEHRTWGAVLARDLGDSVPQTHRVIVIADKHRFHYRMRSPYR